VSERFNVQYEFNVFNVTNTTSLDVPMDQAQIRQNDACSAAAYADKYGNCANQYVNYGQIATSNSAVDQQSALANLDQIPYSTGSASGIVVPTLIPVGALTCTAGGSVTNTTGSGCPNNAANFGSVYNTIGSNRMITMGIHFTY